MRKRIFIRLLLLSFLCTLAVFAAGLFAVRMGRQSALKERLADEARLAAVGLGESAAPGQLASYRGDVVRAELFDLTGECLFDSDPGADAPEFPMAVGETPTFDEFYSERHHCRIVTCAVRGGGAENDGYVLRLSVPDQETDAFYRAAVPVLLGVLFLCVVCSALFARSMANRFSGRIEAVADSLRSLEAGCYKPVQAEELEPEYNSVIWEINELNKRTYAVMEAQSRERTKLATVLDIVAQGIIALDSAFRVVLANRSAMKLFHETENRAGESLFGLVGDDTLCRRIYEYAGGGSFEYRYGDRQLVVNVRTIADHALSREIAQIIIITDVTDARDIAKEKSDFFANASHELKTPITVTMGLSELILAKEDLDGSVRAQVERIHKEASRMSELITDMLRLSRLEQHGEVRREPVNVRTVADEVIAELTSRIAEKKLRVSVTGQGTVQAAPERIYELLTNLCSNAVNYNVDGGELRVSVAEADGHTVLTVRDTGIGIPKEHLPRVCERFYRVDKSRSKKTGGTGLGLAIVKHICVLYGAELKIDSAVGEGTTVTVTF